LLVGNDREIDLLALLLFVAHGSKPSIFDLDGQAQAGLRTRLHERA
jgi:hypothetical protein